MHKQIQKEMLNVRTIHEPIKGEFAKKLTNDANAMFQRMQERKKQTASKKANSFTF